MPFHKPMMEKLKVHRESTIIAKKLDKAAANSRLTVVDYQYALEQSYGVVGKAAEMLGISKAAMLRKMEITPSLAFLQKQLTQRRVDEAEYQLAKQVDEGVLPAITFTLKMLGKERGYTEKSEVQNTLDVESIRDAASLIAAMMRGSKTAAELDVATAIDVKDFTCLEEAESHPETSDPKS